MATPMDIKDQPADTILCLSAEIHISAPASHVFDILVRGNTWPEWNTFCPSVQVTHPGSGTSQPQDDDRLRLGSNMALQVRMKPEAPDSLQTQNCIVTAYEEAGGDDPASQLPHRVSWRALGIPRFLLRADRTSECAPTGGQEGCRFRTWEFMAGPLAYAVKLLYGQTLQDRFEDMARDLKDYAESTWRPSH